MALSNIPREPRREITESLIGMAAVVLVAGTYLWADYRWACWMVENDKHQDQWPLVMVLGLLITFVAIILSGVFVFVTHALGEAICNALARRGLKLRPTVRPRG